MNDEQKNALVFLLNFASEVSYNDSRYAPKDINKAISVLEKMEL